MTQVFVGKVKNIVSEDSLVIVPTKTKQIPAPERLLTLSYLAQTGSFQSKEFLRQLLIGKEIKFKVFSKISSGREFGDVQSPIFSSLIQYLLERGMAKLKENIHDDSEFVELLKDAESEARSKHVGLWDPATADKDRIELVELDDSIIEKSQKSPITMITEKVISGDRIVARVIINKDTAMVTPILLAGVKCPRTDDANQSAITKQVALQAKAFVEDKLLTSRAPLRVSIIGKSQNGLPIGIVFHASGNNIHEKLLESGLAEIVDWQSPLIGSSQMSLLRRAEQTAKALGKGLYANAKAHSSANAKQQIRTGSTIEHVTVAKVISADTIVVRLPSNDEELTVQLASIRAPKPSDSQVTKNSYQQQALVNTAREFVRQAAIGKSGVLYIDGHREANSELGFDSRFMVSFKINGTNDLSELIVRNGMGTVIRHNKNTTQERSANWDRLIEIEEEEKKSGRKGVFFNGDIDKVLSVSSRIIDASENSTKAKTFFNAFRQKGRISNGYYVDYIPAVNRVKLFNPKESVRLTLVLGGLSNSKDLYSEEALKFLNKKFLQRNIEFDVYDTDKVGNFIGNMYVNSKSLLPVQVTLLQQGMATIHETGIGHNAYGDKMQEAEDDAKHAKRGIWRDFDEEKALEDQEKLSNEILKLRLEDLKPKFYDIEVTDIEENGMISFHKIDAESASKFATFKKAFHDFHLQPASATQSSSDLPFNLTKPPKRGELVSAKFSENGKYYRGRIVGYDKVSREFEVKHIDFGNIDRVSLSSLRALPSKFSIQLYPAFAHTCVLQNLRLPPSKPTDYLTEALNTLEDLTFDRKLVISTLPLHDSSAEVSAILYDADESLKDPSYTINKKLVSEGCAVFDKAKYPPLLKDYVLSLLSAQESARSKHIGCWEFGDVMFEDEEI